MIKPVEGRLLDFLVTPEGRILHPTSVMHILREIPVVRESQVVQEELDRVAIHLVPTRPMTKIELDDLHEKFRLLWGTDIRVDIVQKSALSPGRSGKFRPVESRVGPNIVEHMLSSRS